MNITGKSLIEGQWQADANQECFYAFLPQQNQYAEQAFVNASSAEIALATKTAQTAFKTYRKTTAKQRADFLNAIADNILAIGDILIETTMQESGLPEQRLVGERMRTVNQLRFFANDLLDNPDASIVEQGDASREPLPKPTTKLSYLPIGPVAVFGASNFPYAFSVLGGDTASALAAGCPVVVKGHPAHPATSELMANVILKAITDCQLPLGVFSLLQAADPNVSHELVKQDAIKAVGFTGSFNVASSLQKSIFERTEPIPFYGELGSINPQIVFADKMKKDSKALAQTFVGSLMMGQGQFCTSPGVWLIPAGSQDFLSEVEVAMAEQGSAPLLTPGILASYNQSLEQILALDSTSLIARNKPAEAFHPVAQVVKTELDTFINTPVLQQEVFGPYALVVEYQSIDELLAVISGLEGQLTASVHGVQAELEKHTDVIEELSYCVGRLIYNQMPTGVEVCATMNHGGPFPSSTDSKTTSVGLNAKQRFLRPICYQS